MILFKKLQWRASLYGLSIVALLTVVYGFGASACCDDENYNYCFRMIVSNPCSGCQAGQDGWTTSRTVMTVNVGGQEVRFTDFQHEVCRVLPREGGTQIQVRYTKICKGENGAITVQSCSGVAVTPETCDDDDNGNKGVDVILKCDCINV